MMIENGASSYWDFVENYSRALECLQELDAQYQVDKCAEQTSWLFDDDYELK